MHKNTGNFEWYTPKHIIEAARQAMGGIDLDPASCAWANENLVKANRFFSKEENGLAQLWSGRVWLNPPYSAKLLSAFVEKLLEASQVTQACVFVDNITDTKPGQALLATSSAVCFTRGRTRFISPDGTAGNSPMRGQMICGVGVDPDDFDRAFKNIGTCLFMRAPF